MIAFESIVCVDPAMLLRAIEVYETDRLDFAESYLVASAESTQVGRIASFDQAIDRVQTVIDAEVSLQRRLTDRELDAALEAVARLHRPALSVTSGPLPRRRGTRRTRRDRARTT
jgi:hypothetical protein